MKLKPRMESAIISVILLTATTSLTQAAPQRKAVVVSGQASRVHKATFVFDGHNDLPWALRTDASPSFERVDIAKPQMGLQTDIPRLREGNVGAQLWSVFVRAALAKAQAVSRILDRPRSDLTSLSPGKNEVQLEHDGQTRRLIVSTPKTYDRQVAYPILFCFHGAGGKAEGQSARWSPQADKKGLIVISAEAVQSLKKWNFKDNFHNQEIDEVVLSFHSAPRGVNSTLF